jgi:hypothetical protein
MGFLKRICISIIMVVQISVFLPAEIVMAQSTTIEIASGDTLFINAGESIPASSFHIPVEIRNLPDMGSPENGLSSFEIGIKWDPNVIHVDKVVSSTNATSDPDLGGFGWNLYYSNIDNDHGSMYFAGTNVNFFSDDVIFAYFGITAVGNPGDTTQLSLTYNRVYDRYNVLLPVTPVHATIRIAGQMYISVLPADVSIISGTTQQYTAKMHYSDGRNEDITDKAVWSSVNVKIATISTTGEVSPGLATGISEGMTTMIAEFSGIRGSVVLTVTPPEEETGPVVENTETPTAPDTPVETENVTQTVEENNLETPAEAEDISEPAENTQEEIAEDSDLKQDSGLPVVWIIGGVVAFVAVLGVLGYTFLTRRRY